jgi:hypothetical protein
MPFLNRLSPFQRISIATAAAFFLAAAAAQAGGQSPPVSTEPDSHYGLFNLLDHRSSYGQDAFPEPFLVDDSDLETNEARLDWQHIEAKGQQSNIVTAEIEKGFGPVTLELEVPWERDAASGEKTLQGIGNIDAGARCPFFEYVSGSGAWDTTFGAAMEIGIPTNSSVSKNAEFVPKIFNDFKAGNFTVQSIVGYSTLTGTGDDGGLQTLEYGFVFGYTIPHKQLPLPGVQQLIPIFEISGERQMNKGDAGQNSLTGNVGFRANLNAIGPIQPRPGLSFVFPMNDAARQDSHWGVILSLVLEY